MGEIKGYTCDGGCGATMALDTPLDSLAAHGWNTTYCALGQRTLHCCSMTCLSRASAQLAEREAHHLLPWRR